MDSGDGGDGGFDAGFDGGFDSGFDGDYGGIDGIEGDGGLDSVPDGDLAAYGLMLSYGHCGTDGMDCHSGVGHADVNYRPGRLEGLSRRQRAILKKLEKDPMRRFFGVHVASHGFIDLMREFAKIAQAVGCHRIDDVMPNFGSSNTVEPDLADWNRWVPPYTRKIVPLGWYPGATGTTRVQRQVWQLKKPRTFLRPDPEPYRLYDRFANTLLEVMIVTWFYSETLEYETRFQVVVKSLPEWCDPLASWTNRRRSFSKHQAAARTIAEQVLERLKAAPPTEIAVMLRDEVRRRLEEKAKKAEGERTADPATPPENGGGAGGGDCGCDRRDPADTGSTPVELDPRSCMEEAGSGADVLGLLFKRPVKTPVVQKPVPPAVTRVTTATIEVPPLMG